MNRLKVFLKQAVKNPIKPIATSRAAGRNQLMKSLLSMGCFLGFGAIIIFTGIQSKTAEAELSLNPSIWASPSDYSQDEEDVTDASVLQ